MAVLLVVGLSLWPNPMQQTVRQREQIQQTVKQEAEKLNKAADQLAAANLEENNEELSQMEQALRDAAKALEQRAGSGEESLAALAASGAAAPGATRPERRGSPGCAGGAGRLDGPGPAHA